VSEVSYLAKDPIDATREVADLAREIPIPGKGRSGTGNRLL
jgi:hypothetical protein